MRRIDLSLDLGAVAAIDKDPGNGAEGSTEPGRAGEPRGPGQPVVMRRDIFALMRIGARESETPPALRAASPRVSRQSRRTLFGTGCVFKALKHGNSFGLRPSKRKMWPACKQEKFPGSLECARYHARRLPKAVSRPCECRSSGPGTQDRCRTARQAVRSSLRQLFNVGNGYGAIIIPGHVMTDADGQKFDRPSFSIIAMTSRRCFSR